MLECYNEEYRDLLGKGPPAGKKHSVRTVERCRLAAAASRCGQEWGKRRLHAPAAPLVVHTCDISRLSVVGGAGVT
jgi:hypothetical protein